jgi:anti-anti-sigma regulatory factor
MESPSTLVIRLPRHFGPSDGRALERELKKRSIDAETVFEFDLGRLQQIDNAGVTALLACLQWVAKQDGKIQLGAISPEAATLLELTGMDQVFAPAASMAASVVEAESKPCMPASDLAVDHSLNPESQASTVAA